MKKICESYSRRCGHLIMPYRGGYAVVAPNGEHVSQHLTEREAFDAATTANLELGKKTRFWSPILATLICVLCIEIGRLSTLGIPLH